MATGLDTVEFRSEEKGHPSASSSSQPPIQCHALTCVCGWKLNPMHWACSHHALGRATQQIQDGDDGQPAGAASARSVEGVRRGRSDIWPYPMKPGCRTLAALRSPCPASWSLIRPPVTVHSTGTLEISRTVLLVRAASTAVAECSCTGMTLATGSPQLDNTISKPYCLFRH